MKTNISNNFFVLVVIFLLGWFMVFWFLFRKQKPFFVCEITPNQEREKTPGVALGVLSNDLTLSEEKSRRFLPVSACRAGKVNGATLGGTVLVGDYCLCPPSALRECLEVLSSA